MARGPGPPVSMNDAPLGHTRSRPLRAFLRVGARGIRWWWVPACFLAAACDWIVGIREHEFETPGSNGSASGGGGVAAAAGDAPGEAGQAHGARGGSAPRAGAGGAAGGSTAAGGNTFDSEPPSVVGATPTDGKRGVDVRDRVVIEFSEPMDRASVEIAYFQCSDCPDEAAGTPAFTWNDSDTELTVLPGLSRPRATFRDAARSSASAPVSVTYGIGRQARDKAGNPLERELMRTFHLMGRVEHELSTCLDLSGTASAAGLEAAAPFDDSEPCSMKDAEGSAVELSVGDRNGDAVVAIATYSLGDLPEDVALVGANLAFFFDEPVGVPHELYGDLLLERIDFGTDPDFAFDAVGTELGVLAVARAASNPPPRPVKDVRDTVTALLDAGEAAPPLIQFRVRFAEPVTDDNDTPDYARIGGYGTASPRLLLTYDCSACL